MIELAAVAVIVLCVTLVVLAGVWLYNRRIPSANPPRWELREHSDGELLVVMCERPGEQSLLVGSVPWAAPDFGYTIEEVRAEGKAKVVALNSGEKLVR